MCDCINIEIGSHEASVAVALPPHMADLREARVEAGLSPLITVDRCLLDEVRHLWSLGIGTTGCCCGHNRLPGFIGVYEEHIPKMLDLGYQVRPNETDPTRRDGFCPKSIPEPMNHQANIDRLRDWARTRAMCARGAADTAKERDDMAFYHRKRHEAFIFDEVVEAVEFAFSERALPCSEQPPDRLEPDA